MLGYPDTPTVHDSVPILAFCESNGDDDSTVAVELTVLEVSFQDLILGDDPAEPVQARVALHLPLPFIPSFERHGVVSVDLAVRQHLSRFQTLEDLVVQLDFVYFQEHTQQPFLLVEGA